MSELEDIQKTIDYSEYFPTIYLFKNRYRIRYKNNEEIDNLKYFLEAKKSDAAREIKLNSDFTTIKELERQVMFFHPEGDSESLL